ncbi:hypothetical protein HY480_02205 [Candidatus Uhrbacteria bacterium]|nr:hypothetical protein [Candidatus Uhrbacteria bacterium]
MDRRKIIGIIGLIAVVALFGAGIYFLFFRRTPAEAPPTPPIVTPVPVNIPGLPPPTRVGPPGAFVPTPAAPGVPTIAAPEAAAPTPIATGGVTAVRAISEQSAAFVRLASDGRPNYYDSASGRFYRVGADGKPTLLSDRTFPSVSGIAWAPSDDRAILEFPDGANILYDFRTNSQVTLPAHWEDFSFATDGTRIAGKSIGLDRENRWLFAADPDGNNFQAVEPLGTNANRVTVEWSPNNQVVAFSNTGNTIGDERQQIVVIGLHGENFPGIVVEGQGFQPRWSPSGAHILYSAAHSSNDYRPELWFVGGAGDGIGSNRQRIRVNTWADKCTFASETTVYCAVPEELPRGYGLEPSLADRIPDTVERIDLATGVRTTVGTPATDASIRDLTITPDGSTLYYTAKQDGRLYEMRLK